MLRQMTMGPASGRLNPRSMSSLVQWFDALSLSTLYQDVSKTTPVAANSDPIGCWSDKSVTFLDVKQATSGKRPAYRTNSINGLPAVNFTAASSTYLASASLGTFPTSAAGEVWAVIQQINNSKGPQGTIWGVSKTTSASDIVCGQFIYASGNFTTTNIASLSSSPSYDNNFRDNVAAWAYATPYICRFGSTGSSYFIERNGATIDTSALQGANDGKWTDKPVGMNSIALGTEQYSSSQAGFADFAIGEVLVFNANLSVSQANAVRSYLYKRWRFTY